MSASKLVTIFCDGPSCGQWDEQGMGLTAKLARQGLIELGWKTAVPSDDGLGTRDFCPNCVDTTTRTCPYDALPCSDGKCSVQCFILTPPAD